MQELYFDGELSLTNGGVAYIQGAKVLIPKDATMYQIIKTIQKAGYVSFKLPSMRKLTKI